MIKLIAVVLSGLLLANAQAQTQDLPVATPESQGFDSAKLANIVQTIAKAQWPVDSVLLMRNGKVLLDAYFYPYAPHQLHDLRSVTKSVTSSMLGISIAQGKLDGVEQRALPFFPDQQTVAQDARKQALTLGNLVDMRSGFEWSEWPYDQNSTIYRMSQSADWNQFVLAQPMAEIPGEVFSYNGGNMNLLSDIIQQRWGMPMQEVAAQQLFAPLGINRFLWRTDPQGRTIGEAGLFLSPHDLAKLGQLWLNDGVWNGRRLLPQGWTANLAQDALVAERSQVYRRGFWGSHDKTVFFAMGRHGQNVYFDRANQTVLVITAKFADSDVIADVQSLFEHAKADTAVLAANAQAQAKLAETVEQVGRATTTAASVRGKKWHDRTWRLAANPLGIDAIRFTADPNDQGALVWEVETKKGKNIWPVGIDGAYRFKADPLAYNAQLALRATWQDDNTLLLETQYPEGSMSWRYLLRFSERAVKIDFSNNEDFSTGISGQLVTNKRQK